MAFGDNATLFPIYGQAFDFIVVIDSSSSGNPIDAGTLTLTVSKTGAAFAAAAGTATQIGTSGFVKVSLTAVDMQGTPVAFQVASNSSNAIYATGVITPVSTTERTDHWLDRSPVRLEDSWTAAAQYIENRVTQNNNTGQINVYAKGSTTNVLWTQSVENVDGVETKGEAS